MLADPAIAVARPDVAAFLAMLGEGDVPPLESLPVELARAGMRAQIGMADAPAVPMKVRRDLRVPGPGGEIPVRLYDTVEARETGPLILFFHGGGFVIGDLETHDSFCTWLADRSGLPVLSVDYRLAPEHPFPAALDDAEAVARWVAGGPEELGLRPSALITCGDSAGGHLAAVVAQALAERPARIEVAAQWLLYPYVGGGLEWPSVERFAEGYLISREAMKWFDAHYAAPAGSPRHNLLLAALPPAPLLLMTAELDPLRDQGRSYAARAAAAGRQVCCLEAAGMIHGFINLRAVLPSTGADLEEFLASGMAMLRELDVLQVRAHAPIRPQIHSD